MLDTDPASFAEEFRYPCPECGAALAFSPQAQTLACGHCGHKEPRPTSRLNVFEQDLNAALNRDLPPSDYEETRVTHCDNCGADISLAENQQAGACAYCASPLVTDTGTHRHIKPGGLLPFALTEREARKTLGKWLGKRWFAPSGLAKYARKPGALNGIYVPFWTYDAQTRSRYQGRRGDVYYITRGSGKNKRREMRIRWRRASGHVARFFDDILILASTSLPKAYTDDLAPWDLQALEPYTPDYLAGFRAEGYSVPLEAGWKEAQDHIKRSVIRDVKFDIGGDRQQITHLDTDISDTQFKHILLPVWTAAYKFRGQTYRVVINGRSGRVTGERPYSAWKIALAVFALLVAGAGAALLYSQTGGL